VSAAHCCPSSPCPICDAARAARRAERGLDTTTIGTLEATIGALRERALAAEARVRDLEETVGELVALADERCGCGTVFERYCSGCDLP
jgi:hypothetical protein